MLKNQFVLTSALAIFAVSTAWAGTETAKRKTASEVAVTTFTMKGDDARAVVGALLTARVKVKKTGTSTYSYTVNNLVCKTTNHGGPEDYGISYLVGCKQASSFKKGIAVAFDNGKNFYDGSDLVSQIEKGAEASDAMYTDCGMGKCYSALKSLVCTVDVSQEAAQGCNCTVVLPDAI